jgi:NAD-dependent DNA ligase
VDRLVTIFEDGAVGDDERQDLAALLLDMVGEPEDLTGTMDRATRAGFDDPVPSILFEGRTFVLTGRFAYGARRRCEQTVTDRGGRVLPGVTTRTDYVVVGTFESVAWRAPTFGTKIEKAVESRSKGHPVAIIAEEHWIEAVGYDV